MMVYMLVKEIILCVFFLLLLVDMLRPGAFILYGVITLWDGGRVPMRIPGQRLLLLNHLLKP
jgi:hypothetical protein